jgi:hypothetical protein
MEDVDLGTLRIMAVDAIGLVPLIVWVVAVIPYKESHHLHAVRRIVPCAAGHGARRSSLDIGCTASSERFNSNTLTRGSPRIPN